MFRPALVMTALLLSAMVSAQEFNYTYVEGGLLYVDDRKTGLDLDSYGGFVGGSFAVNDNFYLSASYAKVEFDDVDDFDSSVMALGFGFNTSISNAVDFVVSLSWLYAKVDVDRIGSDSDNGVDLNAGIRTWLNDSLEFNAGVGVSKLSDSDNNASVSAGLEYYVTDNISVGLRGSWSDNEVAGYTLGLRYNFDN